MAMTTKQHRRYMRQWMALLFLAGLAVATLVGGSQTAVGFLWASLGAFLIWAAVSVLFTVVVFLAGFLGGPFQWSKKQ